MISMNSDTPGTHWKQQPGVSQSAESNVVISLKQQSEEACALSSQRKREELRRLYPTQRKGYMTAELSNSSKHLKDDIPTA